MAIIRGDKLRHDLTDIELDADICIPIYVFHMLCLNADKAVSRQEPHQATVVPHRYELWIIGWPTCHPAMRLRRRRARS
jgi:hypothetical protein